MFTAATAMIPFIATASTLITSTASINTSAEYAPGRSPPRSARLGPAAPGDATGPRGRRHCEQAASQGGAPTGGELASIPVESKLR